MSERVMKIDRNDKSILIRALHAQYRERKAKGKSYTEIGQLILRIDATAPGRLCLGDDEYLLARNALNDLRNQRIASGGGIGGAPRAPGHPSRRRGPCQSAARQSAVPSLRPYALNYHLYPAREVFPGIFI